MTRVYVVLKVYARPFCGASESCEGVSGVAGRERGSCPYWRGWPWLETGLIVIVVVWLMGFCEDCDCGEGVEVVLMMTCRVSSLEQDHAADSLARTRHVELCWRAASRAMLKEPCLIGMLGVLGGSPGKTWMVALSLCVC